MPLDKKRKFSESATKFAKRMKIPTRSKPFIKRSNLQLNQTRPELKYVDVIATDATIPNGTANVDIVLLNGIAQGTDNTQRIGNKILVKSIDLNLQIFGGDSPTGNPSDCMVKWWIIVDSGTDGSLPAPNNIWELGGGTYMTAHLNLDNSERFKTLATGVVNLAGPSGIPSNPGFPSQQYVTRHISLNDAIRYGSTGATIANINSGSYLLCYTCNYVGGGTGPSIQYNVRTKFSDL